jgi:hypothetical protein
MPLRCVTANPLHLPAEGLWCAPSFRLNDNPATRLLEHGETSAFGALRIGSLLSRPEAARMVELADGMGFVQPAEDESGDRRNGALSWALHDELCETLSRRIAPHVPRAICAHRHPATAERREELLRLESLRHMLGGGGGAGGSPWVRRCDGAPEGTYRYAGINARCRVYRYEPDGKDRFAPHYDEVWPGSRLVLGIEGAGAAPASPPLLEYDGWTYGEGEDGAWAWELGDRVSHLSLLLYLTDNFAGGETVLLSEGDTASIPVTPTAGDALCFGQSFSLGRPDVPTSELAILHEGRPCFPRAGDAPALAADGASGAGFGTAASVATGLRAGRRGGRKAKRAGKHQPSGRRTGTSDGGLRGSGATPKYVLRSDLLYYLPPPE